MKKARPIWDEPVPVVPPKFPPCEGHSFSGTALRLIPAPLLTVASGRAYSPYRFRSATREGFSGGPAVPRLHCPGLAGAAVLRRTRLRHRLLMRYAVVCVV